MYNKILKITLNNSENNVKYMYIILPVVRKDKYKPDRPLVLIIAKHRHHFGLLFIAFFLLLYMDIRQINNCSLAVSELKNQKTY